MNNEMQRLRMSTGADENGHWVTSRWKMISPRKKTSAEQDFAVLQEIVCWNSLTGCISMVRQPPNEAPTMTKGVQDLPVPTKELLKELDANYQRFRDTQSLITVGMHRSP